MALEMDEALEIDEALEMDEEQRKTTYNCYTAPQEVILPHCFICHKAVHTYKVIEECISPHLHIPYAQCIAQSLRNKFIVVVSNDDKICVPCSKLIEERDNLQMLLNKIDDTLCDILTQKYKLSMNTQVISMHEFTETPDLKKVPKQNKPRKFTEELDTASNAQTTNEESPFPENTIKAGKREKKTFQSKGKVTVEKKIQYSQIIEVAIPTNVSSGDLHRVTKRSDQRKNNLSVSASNEKNRVTKSKIQCKTKASFVQSDLPPQNEIVFTCNTCTYSCSSAKELICHKQVHTNKNLVVFKISKCRDSRDIVKEVVPSQDKLSHEPSESSNDILSSLSNHLVFHNSKTHDQTLESDLLQNTTAENDNIVFENNETSSVPSIEFPSVSYLTTDKIAVKKKATTVKSQASKRKPTSIANKTSILKLNKKSKSISKSVTKNFKCGLCSKQMKSIEDLQQHFKSHRKTNEVSHTSIAPRKERKKRRSVTFECAICSMQVKSKIKLIAHLQSHEINDADMLVPVSATENYSNNVIFECGVCSLRFESREELQDHFNSHSKEKIFCKHCNLKLSSLAAFVKHQMYHSDPNKPIVCCICKMQAKNLEVLKIHMKSKHKMTMECSICGEQYTIHHKYKLAAHRNAHPELFPYFCKLCNKKFCNEARFLRHNNWNHKESNCRYCGKEITNSRKLHAHEKNHEAVSCLCTTCGKMLKSKASLKSHIVAAHTKAYRFNCDLCSKGYISKTVLEHHINVQHCHNTPYTCDICGKPFFHQHTLKIHRKWHDDPLPYSCKHCDKKFNHSSRLMEHIRRYHTGEKPHECSYCKKRFFSTNALKSHTSSHTGIYAYNCTECNKGWTKKEHLRKHKFKVHGEIIPKQILEYKMILPNMRPETIIEDDVSN